MATTRRLLLRRQCNSCLLMVRRVLACRPLLQPRRLILILMELSASPQHSSSSSLSLLSSSSSWPAERIDWLFCLVVGKVASFLPCRAGCLLLFDIRNLEHAWLQDLGHQPLPVARKALRASCSLMPRTVSCSTLGRWAAQAWANASEKPPRHASRPTSPYTLPRHDRFTSHNVSYLITHCLLVGLGCGLGPGAAMQAVLLPQFAYRCLFTTAPSKHVEPRGAGNLPKKRSLFLHPTRLNTFRSLSLTGSQLYMCCKLKPLATLDHVKLG